MKRHCVAVTAAHLWIDHAHFKLPRTLPFFISAHARSRTIDPGFDLNLYIRVFTGGGGVPT